MNGAERDRMAEAILTATWPDGEPVSAVSRRTAPMMADALIAAGFGDVTALRAERDLAREDCGHQRAMRESIRVELYTFVGLKVAAEAERDALAAQVAAGEASDGHHTHNELYEYRLLYNAAAFNAWSAAGTYPVVKSWRHSDGELAFGGGWFIVVATLPTGQISNHYPTRDWDLFSVPEVALPPDYDGHTPTDVAVRLRVALAPATPAAEDEGQR